MRTGWDGWDGMTLKYETKVPSHVEGVFPLPRATPLDARTPVRQSHLRDGTQLYRDNNFYYSLDPSLPSLIGDEHELVRRRYIDL